MTKDTVGYPVNSLTRRVDERVTEEQAEEEEDENNTPYHARENALPFTYLGHPMDNPRIESPTAVKKAVKVVTRAHHGSLPVTPTPGRKLLRPNFPTSRPLLQKTPTRQEFGRMLEERLNHVLADHTTQMAQYASIQDDLDELHKRLNKQTICRRPPDELDHLDSSISKPNGDSLPPFGRQRSLEIVPSKDKSYSSDDITKWTEGASASCSTTHLASGCNAAKRSKAPNCPAPPLSLRQGRGESCGSLYTSTDENSPHFKRKRALNRTTSEERFMAKPITLQNMDHRWMDFTRDSSEFWYKPNMSRAEAITLLEGERPGTFIIRKSTSYRNAYGLVLRVPPTTAMPCDQSPPSQSAQGDGERSPLVKHFLIEPTARGVHLKGSAREPVFACLSAFVYQHSIEPMALPCPLIIPQKDLRLPEGMDNDLYESQRHLLKVGAACNVWYLFTANTESLTGNEAIRKVVTQLCQLRPPPLPVEVHFKVSPSGITLTDNKRLLYFRQHYVASNVSHIAMDPEDRCFRVLCSRGGSRDPKAYYTKQRIFAFVARSLHDTRDNLCHVFCDLAPTQPASAIVSFAQKLLPVLANSPHHRQEENSPMSF